LREVFMKRNRWLLFILVFAVLTVGLADVGAAKRGKKKKADGKKLYKELCFPCHGEGSENGEYTPMTLIQDQWDRFFDEKYVPSHEEVLDPNHDNKPVTEVISDESLQAIQKFCIKGAADSEHPMTCG
jgi:hypothetical protein